MYDDQGHILHIDFGFILDICPGGIEFEASPFKLTTEMIELMGGNASTPMYKMFSELIVQAYLAVRYVILLYCDYIAFLTRAFFLNNLAHMLKKSFRWYLLCWILVSLALKV
jgi:hypothetical protein